MRAAGLLGRPAQDRRPGRDGPGTRMSSASGAKSKKRTPSKQFTELGGTPILLHTLRKFLAVPEVGEIYVALRSEELPNFHAQLEKEGMQQKVRLVEGGEHRQESVANALAVVKAADG